jgi:hypothetical protein
MRWLSLVTLPPLLALLSGCSPYVEGYWYRPFPAVAPLPATQPNEPPPVAVLASIIGIRREDQKEGIPFSVEVRLRVDDNGAAGVVFNPQSLDLTNGELLKFAPPLLIPPGQLRLAPGQSEIVRAYFPFPPGQPYDQVDLQSLQLRWVVTVDGRLVGQTVNFRRAYRYYYDYDDPYWGYPGPYYGWYGGWYGGVVVVHRRR